MTRAEKAITKQAEAQGWTVLNIEWEPVTPGPEKAGPAGGWDVWLRRDGTEEWAGGYNVAQVIQWIKNLDEGWAVDPFSCSGKHAHPFDDTDCLLARGHRGDHRTWAQVKADRA